MPAQPMVGPVSRVVGENVQRIRKARGISTLQLSSEAGMHRVALSKLMNGHRRIDADEFVALAAALRISVPQLLGIDPCEVVVVPAVTVSLVGSITGSRPEETS